MTDINRNGYQCIGKPEPLKGNLTGYWSVRIDEKNRLVFRINETVLEIIECGSHYGDKSYRLNQKTTNCNWSFFLCLKKEQEK